MKVRIRTFIFLYLFGVLVNFLVAVLIHEPGYMDAEYYFSGAVRIAAGIRHNEPYIWNFLSSPQTLPVPSFTYWMPLTSLLASIGILLTSVNNFLAARALIILLSGFIPVLTAIFASKFINSKAGIMLAALVSIFSVYYLPYISNTDSFTIYMVLGGLLLILLLKIFEGDSNWFHIFIIGLVTGLLHLARADGLLVLMFVCAVLVYRNLTWRKKPLFKRMTLDIFWILFGYLIVMGFWYGRNLSELGSLIPPGNSLLLFSTSYNDIFKFFTEQLTIDRFLSQGLGQILLSRGKAFLENTMSLLAVNGSLFLAPLIFIGFWKTRKTVLTRLTAGLILLNLLTMSILFPYAGYRGGFFHSNSLVQTALWALVPVGLTVVLDYGRQVRKWNSNQSWKVFSATIIAILVILSTFMIFQRISPTSKPELAWNGRLDGFKRSDLTIREKTKDTTSSIMVNDPPGYHLATGRSTVVVPTDNVNAVLEVAEKFDIRFMILDKNNVEINREISDYELLGDQLQLIVDLGDQKIYEFIKD